MSKCPHHRKLLAPLSDAHPNVLTCELCSGLWVPATVVQSLIGQVKKPVPASNLSNIQIQCPDDQSTLVAVFKSNVEIDVCPTCGGTWLDHGELERIDKEQRKSALADVVSEVAVQPDISIPIANRAGRAIGSALDFIGDVLSGL